MKTRYTLTTLNSTEITTEESRKDYLVITFGYIVVAEEKIFSCSDFNGFYDRGIYIKLMQNTQGDWMIKGIFTLSKPQLIEFTSFIIVQHVGTEIINIYKSGSKIIGYKSLNGAKKALMNKINPPI